MNKTPWWWLAGWLGAVLVLGCGGGAPPNCDRVEPCGGQIAGAWKMIGSCFNSAALSADFATSCPGGSITISRLSFAGAVTFNTDFSYSSTAIETLSVTEVIPLSCLGGIVATCAELAATASPGVSITCTGTSVCTCAISGAQPFPSLSGSYTTSGTFLSTTDSASGSSGGRDYCVQADLVHFVDASTTMNMGPMGQATILSDFVAQKQ